MDRRIAEYQQIPLESVQHVFRWQRDKRCAKNETIRDSPDRCFYAGRVPGMATIDTTLTQHFICE